MEWEKLFFVAQSKSSNPYNNHPRFLDSYDSVCLKLTFELEPEE